MACADDTVTQRLPASFTLDGDDEAGQMIAVSRQRRQPRTTPKRQNTRKAAARQSQISTSLPLQDADVLQSQLLSAHTHTHHKLAANVHILSLPPSQTISQLHSTTPPQQSFRTVVFGGGGAHCFEPGDDGSARKEDGGEETQEHDGKRCRRCTSTVSI